MRSQTQEWMDVSGYRWLGERVQDVRGKVQTKHVASCQMEQIRLSAMRFQFQFQIRIQIQMELRTVYMPKENKALADRRGNHPC